MGTATFWDIEDDRFNLKIKLNEKPCFRQIHSLSSFFGIFLTTHLISILISKDWSTTRQDYLEGNLLNSPIRLVYFFSHFFTRLDRRRVGGGGGL